MRATVNADGKPIAQFDFDNGYTLSLLKRWDSDVSNVSAAYWPTATIGVSLAVHIGSELSDNEVAEAFAKVSALPKASK